MSDRMTAAQYRSLAVKGKKGNRSAAHTALLAAATTYLEIQGWTVFSIPASPYGRNGMPDKVAVKRGRHVWFDAKTGRATLSEDQRKRKAELEAAGAEVIVVHSIEDLYGLGDERQGVLR